MTVPQDIANLLAVAIRDVIWFKRKVLAFLVDCNLPNGIMVEARRLDRERTPTIKIVQHVLERLAGKRDEGARVARMMLTKMYYWKDLHTVPPDRKDQAVASLRAFQEAFQRLRAQQEYQDQQRDQERRMHKERTERSRMSDLDHDKLSAFRDRFDHIALIADGQQRGNQLEALMNDIFGYYCQESKGPVRRTGEQIDGLFKFDNHWHYVEVRWKDDQANAGDVSVLRDRAKSAFGGDTKALLVSFNGFTKECLRSLTNQTDERVILMDGFDLRCVLNCDIAFDVLLAEKQAELVSNKRPFVSAAEIVSRRVSNK